MSTGSGRTLESNLFFSPVTATVQQLKSSTNLFSRAFLVRLLYKTMSAAISAKDTKST